MNNVRFPSPSIRLKQANTPNQSIQGVSKNYARNMQMLNEIKSRLPIHQVSSAGGDESSVTG